MAIQQLDLGRGIDWNPLATMASLQAATQQKQDAAAESKQRLTEGQLNLQRLQLALDQSKKDQAANDAIKARLQKGGDPNEIADDIEKIDPVKGAAYRKDLFDRQAAARAEAITNAQLTAGQPGPLQSTPQAPISVAAPQPTNAPIQTTLPESGQPAQVSTPSAQSMAGSPLMRSISLPNRWQPAPTRTVTIPSATGGAPFTIEQPYLEESTRRTQAAEQFKTNEAIRAKLFEPITTPKGGVTSVIGQDGKPVVIQGQPEQSDIEKEFYGEPGKPGWLSLHPLTNGRHSILADYETVKRQETQPHDVFQESYLPAYLRSHGIGPTSTQAQKDAVTLRANEDYKKIAQDPAMRDILETNAKSVRTDKSFALADSELKDIRKPIDAKADNIAQARDLLSQDNPGANSLAAPVIMKAVAGGQGSGVRITSAEINAVNGGRGKIDDFQSWLSSWSLDPAKYQKLLPDQKVWLKGVLDKIDQKIQAKQSAISAANQALINSTDTKAHRQTMKDLNDSLEMIDRGAAKAPSGGSTTDNIRARLGLPPK